MRALPLVGAVVLARVADVLNTCAVRLGRRALGDSVFTCDGEPWYPIGEGEQLAADNNWGTVRESGIRRALAETEGSVHR